MIKSSKNIERVLARKSFPDFLKAMNYKVDTKEWSEVGGVLNIAMNIMKVYDPEIIFDIGCGKRPTLATLMALSFKKEVIAIDPQLSNNYAKEIKRLKFYKDKLVNCNLKYTFNKKVLVLCNHSHVKKKEIKNFLDSFEEWVYLTVPCCVDNRIDNLISLNYRDMHMHTEKNDIFIYSNNKFNLTKLQNLKG
ncbi:MAG: hypothetical protein ACOC1K_01225 [Nanoarchaeota archaeon]